MGQESENKLNSRGKVVFTTHAFYPGTDGVAVVNHYLAKGLVNHGFDVEVVTHKIDGISTHTSFEGIKIHRVYDGDADGYIDFIKKILNEDDVLINVCMQTPTTDLLLPYLTTLRCRKKILYVHGIWNFNWTNRDYENLHNVCSKIYNNLKWRIYYSKCVKYIRQYNTITQLHEMDGGNIFFKKHYNISSVIMENAADDAFFEKADDSDFIKKYSLSENYLVCVANYGAGKNQEMVLRAYYKSNTSRELIFVGRDTGGYINHLKETELDLHKKSVTADNNIDQCSNKKVRYFKDITRDEIPFFVRNSGLFLFGSIGEKFPVSIVEPMAAGVPFISTDVGIVRYFPGGVTVKINDVDAMADQIDKILADSDKWNRLSEEGRKYAMSRMRIQDKVDQLESMLI